MKHVILDCSLMTDDRAVHDIFSRELDFPASYGRNLDALYDLLSASGELTLTLANADALKKLFRYGDNLLLTLKDADAANPLLTLEIQA